MAKEEKGDESPSEAEMAILNRAKEQAVERLLAIPDVHTVGVGYKRVDGRITDQLAVLAYVDQKLPATALNPAWIVPAEILVFVPDDGAQRNIPTDVIERGRPVEYPHIPDGALAGRGRPVPGGRSIEGGLGGGTLGGWVWDDINDGSVLLSNRHVLGSTAGTDVYQPWGSNAPADQIADNVRTGTLDATIAAHTDLGHVLLQIEGVGPAVYETAVATLNMQVEKSGATTEHTTGRVVAVNLSTGHAGSTNDFEVLPEAGQDRFAFFGDSGSLIVERNHPDDAIWKRVVGLLWGGIPDEGNAFGHQLEDVFADLDLTAVCSGTVASAFDSLFAEMSLKQPVLAGGVPAKSALPEATGRDRLRTISLNRGLARDVDARIRKTGRGDRLSKLIRENRVDLARLAVSPSARRILHAAAEPFVNGLWSADEVLEQ